MHFVIPIFYFSPQTFYISGFSSSEELVFSSQEKSPIKFKKAKNVDKMVDVGANQKQNSSSNKSISESSSYNSFADRDEELNLFSDEDDNTDDSNEDNTKRNKVQANCKNEDESLRLYISGESEVEGEDTDVNDEFDIDKNCDERPPVVLNSKKEIQSPKSSDKIELKEKVQNNYQNNSAHRLKYSKEDRIHPDECDDKKNQCSGDENTLDFSSDSELVPNSQENVTSNANFIPFSSYVRTSSGSKLKSRETATSVIKDALDSMTVQTENTSSHSSPERHNTTSLDTDRFELSKVADTPSSNASPKSNDFNRIGKCISKVVLGEEEEEDRFVNNNINSNHKKNNKSHNEDLGMSQSQTLSYCDADEFGKEEESNVFIPSICPSASIKTKTVRPSEILFCECSNSIEIASQNSNKSDTDSNKDSSVEFLYDEPLPLKQDRNMEEQGWLSKQTPRRKEERQKSQKRRNVDTNDFSQTSKRTLIDRKSPQQTIDLTLDDSE